jgi:hypothetical protein
MDSVFWAMNPGYPTSIEPVAMSPQNDETFPNATVIKWEFPARDERPPFVVYWYDGGLRPPRPAELGADRDLPNTGNLYVGTKGKLLVSGDYGNNPHLIPATRHEEVGKPPQLLERSPGHMAEWILACTGEKPWDYPGSSFLYAAPMTETILLGNVALTAGRRIKWDGDKMEITNMPEANQWITKEYREGWKFEL